MSGGGKFGKKISDLSNVELTEQSLGSVKARAAYFESRKKGVP